MNNLIETINYKGHEINVHWDDMAESPRKYPYEPVGTIAYKHSRYNLGEEEIGDPIDWLIGMLDKKEDEEFEVDYTNEVLRELEVEFAEKFYALRLFLYDHGGISISTESFIGRAHHAEWDSCQVGYVYVDKETAHKEWSDKDKILQYLEEEIETYDQFLRGEVYGYTIEGEECEDSCWGFYDEKYMIEEAKSMIDYSIKRKIRKHI